MGTQQLIRDTNVSDATGPHGDVWTKQSLAQHIAETPEEWDVDDDPRYVRPVTEFGLTIRVDPIKTPRTDLRPELMPSTHVRLDLVRSSTQTEGVVLSIVDHYVNHPNDLYDPDGWFGNNIPVLYARADGTYTVRDGNHRVIAAKLRGDEFIEVHYVS